MTAITVAGGVYHERCVWPAWDQIYGSGGRAAAALTGLIDSVTLCAYARADTARAFNETATGYGFAFRSIAVEQSISFEYIHSLSNPQVIPIPSRIRSNSPYNVSDDVVLRFGMMEGSAVVSADRCVYDPQSAFDPQQFAANGSHARRLAIVGNRSEIVTMGDHTDPIAAARVLLAQGAEVVVVKSGPAGALVIDSTGHQMVPAYRSEPVWTIGSGDVFAAAFAGLWGVDGVGPVQAAELSSKAVAAYAGSMGLPTPSRLELKSSTRVEAATIAGRAYLASPFFALGQRWLVDEARRCLLELGMEVFSPVHNVGPGPAADVAPADLAALNDCDVVFAVLDGLDSGTLFEVGYAHARGKPIYALAQTVSEEDMKMIVGSGCRVYDDFVTALHHLAWRV